MHDARLTTGVLLNRLIDAISLLPARNIVCFGDVMLDLEIQCSDGRISPEAPVLVFAEQDCTMRPGGAANVAANVAALGCKSTMCALVGQDAEGDDLATMLEASGVETRLTMPTSKMRPTTRKTRFVSDGQQLLRIDRETSQSLNAEETTDVIKAITDLPQDIGCLLVSDYGKGLVTVQIMDRLRELAQAARCPILVDPKGTDWTRYGKVALIKPNATELASLTGMSCKSDKEVEDALVKALDLCTAEAVLVTRSADGASLITRDDQKVRHFDAQRVGVADVCGAGDTNLAALGAMLASGFELDHAILIAQIASSVAVQRHGNAVVSSTDLKEAAEREWENGRRARILTHRELMEQVSKWRSSQFSIGMTNGCFDLLHAGHLRSLEFLKDHSDRVIVALNSNASVARLKGPSRPYIDEQDRAKLLAGLGMVDAVVIFDDETPEKLILDVVPDVLCKGKDYKPEDVVGGDFVKSNGGKIILCEIEGGVSTSIIVERILSSTERM